MKIIITGGSGFLGTHLCRALNDAGHSIKIIDLKQSKDFKTTIADVRDHERMIEEIKEVDLVFHLAALIEAGESVKNPQKFVDYNISGSISVLEAMRSNGIKRFIFSSSAAVYGEPISTPIKEDDRTIPINPYGMTKLAIEGALSSYVKSHDFSGVALRYFNLYGPEEHHQPETHAIPRFINQIINDQEVTVWGNGQHLRDYIHVRDVVRAHLNAIDLIDRQPGVYHYYNLSTNQPASVIDIIKLIEKILNKSAIIKHFPDRPGDPLVLTANANKALEELSWRSEVGLEEGLVETVDYFLH